MTWQVIEDAAMQQVADAARRIADIAAAVAQGYSAGLPEPKLDGQLVEAVQLLEWRKLQLAAARAGYGRLEAAKVERQFAS